MDGLPSALVRSVVRRQFVAQAAGRGAGLGQRPFTQRRQRTLQRVDLRLLAHHHLVQAVEQVFAVAGLDLQRGQALFGAVVHGGPILHRPPAAPGAARITVC